MGWLALMALKRKIAEWRKPKPRTIDDEPTEVQTMFYQIVNFAVTMNDFRDIDLRDGPGWKSFEDPYGEFLEKADVFDFNSSYRRSGPYLFLEVRSKDDDQVLLSASCHEHDEFSFLPEKGPDWFYKWQLKYFEDGEWNRRVDDHTSIVFWLIDIKAAVKAGESGPYGMIDDAVIQGARQAIENFRSTGELPDPEQLVTV